MPSVSNSDPCLAGWRVLGAHVKVPFLSGVVLIALGTGAMAADLVERHVIKAELPPLPAPSLPPLPIPVALFNWTGAYGGLNAGGGFPIEESGARPRLRGTAIDGTSAAVARIGRGSFLRNSDDGGVLGGGQVGYNLQMGSVVVGVEADAQATDLGTRDHGFQNLRDGVGVAGPRGTVIGPVGPGQRGNVAFFNDRGSHGADVFGTLRGRVGYAYDQFMVYGTGGLAWTLDEDRRGAFSDGEGVIARNPGFFTNAKAAQRAARVASDDGSHLGYTVGAGVEYAFSPMLSARLEGLYVDFSEDRSNRVVGVANTGAKVRLVGASNESDFALFRTGINYRFGTW